MISFDYEIQELKDFLQLLHKQKGEILTNYGIKQFWKILNEHENLKELTQKLLQKHNFKSEIDNLLNTGNFIGNILGNAKTAEEYISVCLWTVKEINDLDKNIGTNIYLITVGVVDGDSRENYKQGKEYFIGTYIEPIVLYLERNRTLLNNKISILKRYQLLCHNFDKDEIKEKIETYLTSKHLAKFLFNEGINNILTETIVKSGRMDAFIYDEKESIIIEGKIYNGKSKKEKHIYECISQVQARFGNIHFSEGYAVIYNKSNNKIEVDEYDGTVLNIPYWLLDQKKIFILIIDLGDIILKNREKWNSKIEVTKISKSNYKTLISSPSK